MMVFRKQTGSTRTHRFVSMCASAMLLLTLTGCPEPEPGTHTEADATPEPEDVAEDSTPEPPDEDLTEDPTPEPPAAIEPVINEILASADPEAEPNRDWVELYNPGTEPLSLGGYFLIDGPIDGVPSPLDPSLEIPAGGHLLLIADGSPELGPTHLPFRLSVDGERLRLLHEDEVIDDVDFGELLRGWSLARNGDGSHDWEVRDSPTPGEANPLGAEVLPPADVDPCLPHDEDEAHLLEGESFVMALLCEGADIEGYDVVVHTPGEPGTWDGEALTWTLETDLDDAGRHELLFAIKPKGAGGFPETRRVAVNVVDAWGVDGNVPPDPTRYLIEWGLPVLHIDPAGSLTQEYIDADAHFDGEHYTATIKIRGASSVNYPKNSFTMEFEPEQLDLRELGMSRKDHVVLISNFDDAAYVRQKLVFDVWAEMAAFRGVSRLVPRTAWVVVYLNGEYHGLYTFIDHIDDEFLREMDFDDSGNLYKSINHDANYYLHRSNNSPKENLAAGWEQKEGPDTDYADLIALTEWVGNASAEDFAAGHSDWIIVQEFMDWFLLVMHLAAADSAGKNAYMYNDPLGSGWRYVPWDFNHSLGQNWRTRRVEPDWYSSFTTRNGIFAHIHADPALSEAMWAHYAALREPGAPLSADRLGEMAAASYALIEGSAERDWARWGEQHRNYGGWVELRGGADVIGGYPEERAYFEQWLLDREAAMFERFPQR